jgi:penicillin-binding protein 2
MAVTKEKIREEKFSRRAFVLGAFQGTLVLCLGARLAWLQVAEGKKYKTLADKNRINVKITMPSRGEIVDRFGVPLAVNKQNFHMFVIPEQTHDLGKTLKDLTNVVDLSPEKIKNILEESKKTASFIPIEVMDGLNWQQVSKLEVNITDFPGVEIEEGQLRDYPLADATGHIVGYVGAVAKNEIENDPMFKLPGFRIGKTGIEKSYDKYLRGDSGRDHVEVNVRGREIRRLETFAATAGQRVSLSVDAELQRYCQQRLSEYKSASCTIMDVHSGAIYAMASYPGFDPNLFTGGISAEQWEELLSNPAFPLNNKAVSGQYPPGSTFKMITAMAALEEGIAHAGTIVNCKGSYEYGTDRFHCWKLSGHGITTVTSALMESCDTYFYKLSTDLGIESIAQMARRLGLDQKYDFGLPEERQGLMPTKAWKEKRYGEVWRPGETIVSSIGQGYILATPLQLAVMTSRLVNGGKAVEPWIVGYVDDKKVFNDEWPSIGLKPSNLRLVKLGMDRVVNNEDGTAYGSRIENPKMAMGGKTGTAQVKRISRYERAQGIKNEDLAWKYRHHALFVGYAPLNNPRYVCSVVVEHGGGGSAVAAPLAKDILVETQKRDPASRNMKIS